VIVLGTGSIGHHIAKENEVHGYLMPTGYHGATHPQQSLLLASERQQQHQQQ